MSNNNKLSEISVAASNYDKEKKYWVEKLSNDLILSKIPYDFSRQSGQRVKFECITSEISDEALLKLNKLCGKSDLKKFMVLTSALYILILKYTDNKDISIGIPVLKGEDIEGEVLNSILVLRNSIDEDINFKELLLRVRQSILDAVENQNYPYELLKYYIGEKNTQQENNELFDILVMMENLHDKTILGNCNANIIVLAKCLEDMVSVSIKYNTVLYSEQTIRKVLDRYIAILESVLNKFDMVISDIDLLSEAEREDILYGLICYTASIRDNKTIHQLFDEQVSLTPDNTAVVFGDSSYTYRDLYELSNKIANYLLNEVCICKGDYIGVLMSKSKDAIASILGILKAGGAYIPMESGFPEQRLKHIISDAEIKAVVSEKKYVRILDRLQYECGSLKTYLCVDIDDINTAEEQEKNGLMDKQLWDFVAQSSTDEITAGGWYNSYTGEAFSRQEMDEYGDNVLKKLSPILNKNMKLLEIGCASGISMYRIAPLVGSYYGTDISSSIIKYNKNRIADEGHTNIKLACIQAHDINTLDEKEFDLIIINSVIQSFHGYRYLRKVIQACINLLGDYGSIFIGDVMDQDLKYSLIENVNRFKKNNSNKKYKTKTNWSNELFVSRTFFEDLAADIHTIDKVEFSQKIHSIQNELTKYRYDVLISVNNKTTREGSGFKKAKCKYQHDLATLGKYSIEKPIVNVEPCELAYIIYTSGTTGMPKGAMIEHRNVINLIAGLKDRIYSRYEGFLNVSLVANLSFDASVQQIFGALLQGHTLFVVPDDVKRNGESLLNFCIENDIDIIDGTPMHLKLMTSSLNTVSRPDKLKHLIIGGEKLPKTTVEDFMSGFGENCPAITNIYGPTECCVDSTTFEITKDNIKTFHIIPIGKPMPNQKIYILNNNKLQAFGIAGELCIGGMNVGRGYLKRDDLTTQRFTMDPFVDGGMMYRTGDMARWLPDGNIEFLGRIDNQIKVRGYRIEVEEIEHHLIKNDGIKDAVVLSEIDCNGNANLIAYVVLNNENTVMELREHLLQDLPEYMIPTYFIKVDKIHMNASGKVDRKTMDSYGIKLKQGGNYVTPRNKLEQVIYDIWQECLGFEIAGVSDNFFALGGDSLKGMMIVNRYRELFDEMVYIGLIFEATTIEEHAQYLSKNYPKALNKSLADKSSTKVEVQTSNIDKQMVKEIKNLIPAPSSVQIVEKKEKQPAIFILCSPRTGSTLLRVVLGGHSKLFSPQELDLLPYSTLSEKSTYGSTNLGSIRAIMEINGCDDKEAFTIWEQFVNQGMTIKQFYSWIQKGIGNRVLVDKTPAYALHVDTMKRAEMYFENPIYIHLVRHPYGMIHSFVEARLDLLFGKQVNEKYNLAKEELAELNWIICQQNIMEFLKDIPKDRKYTVRYEDLVKDLKSISEDICNLLGIEFQAEMLEPYKDDKKRMTDAIHNGGQMIGDGKFNNYQRIESSIADKWSNIYKSDFLSEELWKIAEKFNYERINNLYSNKYSLNNISNNCNKDLMEIIEEYSEDEIAAALDNLGVVERPSKA